LLHIKITVKQIILGDVESFANIASTVSEFFNLENIFPGKSFLNQI